MTSIELVIAMRGLERLLLVIAGALAIYFGYRLFREKIETVQVGDVKFFGWMVGLKQVGPGVFFALFGAVILSISIAHTLKIDNEEIKRALPGNVGTNWEDERPPTETIKSSQELKIELFGDSDDRILRGQAKALQSAMRVSLCEATDSCAALAEMKRGAVYIEALRNELLKKRWGDDVLKYWDTHKSDFHSGAITDADVLKRMGDIQPWIE